MEGELPDKKLSITLLNLTTHLIVFLVSYETSTIVNPAGK